MEDTYQILILNTKTCVCVWRKRERIWLKDGATKAVFHSDSPLIFSPRESSGRILVAADVPWLWHPRFLQLSAIFAFLPLWEKPTFSVWAQNVSFGSCSRQVFFLLLLFLSFFFGKALKFSDVWKWSINLEESPICCSSKPSISKQKLLERNRLSLLGSAEKNERACADLRPRQTSSTYIFLITNKYFFRNWVCLEELQIFFSELFQPAVRTQFVDKLHSWFQKVYNFLWFVVASRLFQRWSLTSALCARSDFPLGCDYPIWRLQYDPSNA